MDLETCTGVYLRKLICWYIIAAAYTFSARKEMHSETRRKLYSSATINTSEFRIAVKTLDNPLDTNAKRQLPSKYSVILLMAFEAAIKLQEWDRASGIIEEAESVPC